jgi:hypothetical protein
MEATFNLPGDPELLEAALEGLVQVNQILIERGDVPADPRDAGVRYQRESTGLEEWNDATLVLKNGWGDCEDLAAWEVARMRSEGDDGAMLRIIEPGRPGRFHAVAETGDGEMVDVCLELGMGRRSARSSNSIAVSGKSLMSMLPKRMQPRRPGGGGGGLINSFIKVTPRPGPTQPPVSQPQTDPYQQQADAQYQAQQAMEPSDPYDSIVREQWAEDPMEYMSPLDEVVDDSESDEA